jgi:hypothetical protein
LGTGRPRRQQRPRFGSEQDQRSIVRILRDPALEVVCRVAVAAAISMASPGSAGLIWAGWTIYKYGKNLAELGQQLESVKAQPRSRQTSIALRVGLKAGLSFLADAGVESSVDSGISVAVNTTANELSRKKVFEKISRGLGLPEKCADDLRYFFIASSTKILKHAYSEARDKIIDRALGEMPSD